MINFFHRSTQDRLILIYIYILFKDHTFKKARKNTIKIDLICIAFSSLFDLPTALKL